MRWLREWQNLVPHGVVVPPLHPKPFLSSLSATNRAICLEYLSKQPFRALHYFFQYNGLDSDRQLQNQNVVQARCLFWKQYLLKTTSQSIALFPSVQRTRFRLTTSRPECHTSKVVLQCAAFKIRTFSKQPLRAWHLFCSVRRTGFRLITSRLECAVSKWPCNVPLPKAVSSQNNPSNHCIISFWCDGLGSDGQL